MFVITKEKLIWKDGTSEVLDYKGLEEQPVDDIEIHRQMIHMRHKMRGHELDRILLEYYEKPEEN
jgi:hypothetical protein